MVNTSLKPIWRVCAPLLALHAWAVPAAIVLGTLASFTEGTALALFVPLFQGLDQSSVPAASPLSLVTRWANRFPVDQRFSWLVGCIIVAVLVRGLLVWATSALSAWLHTDTAHILRRRLFDQIMSAGYGSLERKEPGQLVNAAVVEAWHASQAVVHVVSAIISLCTALVFSALLLVISVKLTLIVAAGLAVGAVLVEYLNRDAKVYGQQATLANQEVASSMLDTFLGLRTTRVFGLEALRRDHLLRFSEQLRHTYYRCDLLIGSMQPLSEVLQAALLLAVLVVAARHRAELPTLLVFVFVLYRLQPQLTTFYRSTVELTRLTGAIGDLMSFLSWEPRPPASAVAAPSATLQEEIVFDRVTFRYQPEEKPALDDVSFRIPRGRTTAIVGPSGAGKTTLVNLLCRLYDPQDGRVLVDGRDLRDTSPSAWLRLIGLAGQGSHLFHTTIWENIRFGRPEATDAEVVAAAERAHADLFIRTLAGGYDTVIGEGGVRLSGGQQQRVALARALLRGPELLILDEATNALDSLSEQFVLEALRELHHRCTLVVIAHRLATVQQADHVIALEHGKVAQEGPWAELLRSEGLLTTLYNLQQTGPATRP